MSKTRPYNYKQDKASIKQLLLETVTPKTNNVEFFVIHAIGLNGVLIGRDEYTFQQFFDTFTFADGSVCGIEEEK
jgi:hypothetical protein